MELPLNPFALSHSHSPSLSLAALAVAHWSIKNLFEVESVFTQIWTRVQLELLGKNCGYGSSYGSSSGSGSLRTLVLMCPKGFVSSLCSLAGCVFLGKCLPTFGFIINFKKLLMAGTRCPSCDGRDPTHHQALDNGSSPRPLSFSGRCWCLGQVSHPSSSSSPISRHPQQLLLILEAANWPATLHVSLESPSPSPLA